MVDEIRGPTASPLLGHALSLSRDGLAFLRACAGEYGDLVPLRFVWKRILFVNHPDYVGQVLATNHGKVGKALTRRVDQILLGGGLSLREGDSWLRERRIMQPSFQRERLATYGGVVVALAERAIGAWRDGEIRDVYAEMTKLTRAIVAKTLFGIDVWGDAAELAETLSLALSCRNARVRSPGLLLPDRLPSPANLRIWRARQRFDATIQRIIDERRTNGDAHGDLLSLLLRVEDKDGGGLTDQQVKDEVMTVFVGGTETVADLLTWVWYLLSQHLEVNDRLRAEVDAALDGGAPTVSDLKRLPYAGTIVQEALRLYPPASVLAREALADFDVGPFRVARGTTLLISPWVMHRDPRYFAAPDSFDPDRWANGLASRLPPYAYLPFGGGPRLCIGRSFATMEALLVLASVARRYQLELVPGHSVVDEPIPTLRPKFGLRMVARARGTRDDRSG